MVQNTIKFPTTLHFLYIHTYIHTYIYIYIYIYIHTQGVSGGKENILGRGSMDYSE